MKVKKSYTELTYSLSILECRHAELDSVSNHGRTNFCETLNQVQGDKKKTKISLLIILNNIFSHFFY